MLEQVIVEIARNVPAAAVLLIAFKWTIDLFSNHLSQSIKAQTDMAAALRALIDEIKDMRRGR